MKKIILFSIFIVGLAFLNIFPAAGSAQSLDQIPVIDDAEIFENRIGDVEAAAKKLQNQGADIRVRTIFTYGSAGNLDRYEAQLEQASTSWLAPDNNLKSNLIVLIISLQERQTGLYYGLYWEDILDGNWMRIQTDIMNPLFKIGDYAGGTIKGMEEIQRLIQNRGQTQPVSPTGALQPQPGSLTGTGQPQPVSQSGTGRSMGWIVPVVIVVIAGLIVGLLLIRSSRKNQAKRLAARQKAILAKQGAASGINELLETLQLLEIKVSVTADKISAEEGVILKDGLEKARGLINQSSQTYSELSHSAGDPENPKLGETELGVIEGEYQKILGNLRQAREAIKGTEEQIAAIQQAVDGFPGKVAEIKAAIEDALSKQDELKKSGFKTIYPAELVDKGRSTLEQAQGMVSRKRIIEGMKYVSLAGDQIKQAIQAAEELPRKKQEAEAAIPVLTLRIEQVKAAVNNGRDIFERVFREYAETTWASVRGNGTEAENRINWALDVLDDARSAIGVQQQEWQKALELVEKGNQWLEDAEALMQSISGLEVNLTAARRDAPNEIDAAQADITKAWEYINKYDDDIRESLEDDLSAAEKNNDLAREELKKEKPDYFSVNKLAREANVTADKILVQARDEHETAERLRAKAVSSLRDAGAKVSIARTYIEVHHPEVRSEARNYLVNAIEALRQAGTAVDTNSQISLALNAEAAADQAYSLARRDVDSTTMNRPNIGIPMIIIPPSGRPSGGGPSWGSSRSNNSGSGGHIRRSGGGSSGWGSGGGGGFSGGGASRRGGSTGW